MLTGLLMTLNNEKGGKRKQEQRGGQARGLGVYIATSRGAAAFNRPDLGDC